MVRYGDVQDLWMRGALAVWETRNDSETKQSIRMKEKHEKISLLLYFYTVSFIEIWSPLHVQYNAVCFYFVGLS